MYNYAHNWYLNDIHNSTLYKYWVQKLRVGGGGTIAMVEIFQQLWLQIWLGALKPLENATSSK